MPGGAKVWEPRELLEVTADTKAVSQRQVAVANQLLFTLTEFAYALGTGALEVYKDGLRLVPGIDFVEITTTSYSLVVPASVGEVYEAVGNTGISGTVATTDIMVANHPALRAYTDLETTLFSRGRLTSADGFEGMFVKVTGAAPGTYVDDDTYVIVPTGGDGSIAWLGAPVREGTANFYGATDTGAANAHVVALPIPITAYTTGKLYWFKAGFANTGASTVNYGGGAKAIKKLHDQDTTIGDIEVGGIYGTIYDGTNMQIINPSAFVTLGANIFTGIQTSPGQIISGSTPSLRFTKTDDAADDGEWVSIVGAGNLTHYVQNDAQSISTAYMQIARTGATVDLINLIATVIQMNGNAVIDVSDAASKAEQEAATSVLKYVSPGTQNDHPSATKVWARIDIGGNTINASHGLTSITALGTGRVRFTFSTAFSSAHYSQGGTAKVPGTNADDKIAFMGPSRRTANPYTTTTADITAYDPVALLGVASEQASVNFNGDQ